MEFGEDLAYEKENKRKLCELNIRVVLIHYNAVFPINSAFIVRINSVVCAYIILRIA